MPPRRSHKKSRAGCRRCKNRKIKCDEVHPRCGNCAKHGVLCDFGNPDIIEKLIPTTTISEPMDAPTPAPINSFSNAPNTPSILASPVALPATSLPATPLPATPLFTQPPVPNPSNSNSNSNSSSSSSSSSNQVDRLLELRLLHQYTTFTYKTLVHNSPMAEDTWQRIVPQMAFSGKTYLVDAILSVAALHLRALHPEDKALVQASHAYSASTLAAYCAALNAGITPDNAEALFLTASLIAFQATASRIFNKDDANNASSRYAVPLAWFHAFQGVKAVVASSWQWISGSSAVKAVIDSQPSFALNMNPRATDSFFGHLMEGLEEELATEEPHNVVASGQAYAHAVCVINWAHTNYYAAASLAFPSTVSKRFVELVEAKRPRALAILACFFALLKRMDGVWWLQDVARREVMGLVSLFEPRSKWWKHLEWPIRIALWDGNMITPDVWGAAWETEAHPEMPMVDSMMHHIELMADLLGQSQAPNPEQISDDPPIAPDSPD